MLPRVPWKVCSYRLKGHVYRDPIGLGSSLRSLVLLSQPVSLCNGLRTVLPTYYQGLHCCHGFIHCWGWRPKQWRTMWLRPSSRGTNSWSPTSASFIFIEKKDGRPYINYHRRSMRLQLRYLHPLPLTPQAIMQLRGVSIYTKLDHRCTYNLVHIRADNEWMTVFTTMSGHYHYHVMPYGLSNTSFFFQALMNDVLRDMLNRLYT